jgi:hypothetical protein
MDAGRTSPIFVNASSARPDHGADTQRGFTASGSTPRPRVHTDRDGITTITKEVCLDSGAEISIVPAEWITADKRIMRQDDPCAVRWGDSTKSKVVVKGTCRFWIGKLQFQVHAWGVPEVNRALISATQLTDHGAHQLHRCRQPH